ncbi:hypothetical protein [Brachyspira hyodysenteriae]|uniref:hypothetical protein n=1 Tax=Brachyspira hyodysenteriae TaxID=159 RepID=UPI000A6A981D|nr:hypothetical protein [Brachyspira hyodysenteriae]HJH55082.1 hypothetical protein [Brachyspira hyodysenteriae]
MSLLKDIFKKKKTIKCAVCGEALENRFKAKYINLNGCYELHLIHFECDEKIKSK